MFPFSFVFFFFNDTATTEIYPLSLHDALPISLHGDAGRPPPDVRGCWVVGDGGRDPQPSGRRAVLVLLPGDAGRELGRSVVRGPALSGGCHRVRRPRGVDQPRHGRGATAVGCGSVT